MRVPPGPLLRLLGAPDGLPGDAEGPCHRGLGLPVAERQAWRALLLVIKATLEAVETGITSVEQEFLPNMVLPDNSTVGENMLPRLREIITSGHLPPMLPAAHPIALGPPTP